MKKVLGIVFLGLILFSLVSVQNTSAVSVNYISPPIGIPTLIKPENGTIVDNQPLFQWKNVSSSASLFRIQVSNVSTFYRPVVDITTVNLWYQVTKNMSVGFYYWHVRIEAPLIGNWSNAWYFVVNPKALVQGQVGVVTKWATLEPNEKFAVPIDLSNYTGKIISIGLPNLVNNTWYLGVEIDGQLSSSRAGSVWLGLYLDVFSDKKTTPMSYSYGNNLVYVEFEYIGDTATNQTIILALGDEVSPFHNSITLLIPLMTKKVGIIGGVISITPPPPIIVNPIVIIAGIVLGVFGVELYHRYKRKYSHRFE